MDKEPSVLDYLKSLLTFNNDSQGSLKHIFQENIIENPADDTSVDGMRGDQIKSQFGFISLFLILGISAQVFLSQPVQNAPVGIILYTAALITLVFGLNKSTLDIQVKLEETTTDDFAIKFNKPAAISAGVLFLISTAALTNNQFTTVNVLLWISTIFFTVIAFWKIPLGNKRLSETFKAILSLDGINIRISKWLLLTFIIIGIVLFFRFYRLNLVPGEMWSDHAEKLLDVMDVLNGQTPIFFPRNTGREGFQIYLTAFIARYFGTGISFLSLKLGTAIAGLISLIFVYLLGKEYGGKYAGLTAAFLMGIGYWPNIISRVGLRYAFYPLFAAPVLYFLIKGLRTRNINNLIISGLLLGLGMHGYSAFRAMPFLILAGFLLFWMHSKNRVNETLTVKALFILVIISLVVFLPLARYAIENPDMFSYRMLSRLGTLERDYPGSIVIIFLENLWKSIIMPFWKNGNIWVHSIPDRPALDTVTAVLFLSGVILVIYRYIKTHDWRDLFLLISIPLLMLPSILSLAFPEENPSLNRSAGAMIPIFVLAGIGLTSLWKNLSAGTKHGPLKFARTGIVTTLLLWSTVSNFNLVFKQYDQQFMKSALNTSEIGTFINHFAHSVGSYDTAYVIPYPHWVDTRLVGINAGVPGKDFALWIDQIRSTTSQLGTKLFILKPEDHDALTTLQSVYDNGNFWNYASKISGKEFLIYIIPAIP